MTIFHSVHLYVCPIFGLLKEVIKFIKIVPFRERFSRKNAQKNVNGEWVMVTVIKIVTFWLAYEMVMIVTVLLQMVVKT